MRFGSVTFATVPSVGVALALVAGGCGGIYRNDGEPDGSVATGSGGRSGVGSGARPATGASTGSGASTASGATGNGARPPTGTGGAITKPPVPTCGNGRIDAGEECDGPMLGGATCASVTMGAKPAGVLTCTKGCTISTTGCVGPIIGGAGAPGTGGFTSVGGRPGTGGYTYDSCMNQATIIPNACTAPCGCKVCPDLYAACRADGGCAWILACAQQQGCASVAQCYSTPCSSIINSAGGLMSVGARLADPALACLAQSGCGIACSR